MTSSPAAQTAARVPRTPSAGSTRSFRRRFLSGPEASELEWFTPAGTPMNGRDWADPNARAIAIYLDGSDDPDRAQNGTLLVDDDFLVLVNSWWGPLAFVLPRTRPGAQWHAEIDSYDPAAPPRRLRAAAATRSPSAPGPSPSCVPRGHNEHRREAASSRAQLSRPEQVATAA